jgi:hypothetical protein
MKGICFSCTAMRCLQSKAELKRRGLAMQQIERKPLFNLGQLVATPGALMALEKSGRSPMDFISRHVTGDWGDIPKEDHEENDFSLKNGLRLLSSYHTIAGKIWIITEADRSATTLLLPEEY